MAPTLRRGSLNDGRSASSRMSGCVAYPRGSVGTITKCRRPDNRAARRSPNWRCLPCCGARLPRSARSRAARRATPAPASAAGLAPARSRRRASAPGRGWKTGWWTACAYSLPAKVVTALWGGGWGKGKAGGRARGAGVGWAVAGGIAHHGGLSRYGGRKSLCEFSTHNFYVVK